MLKNSDLKKPTSKVVGERASLSMSKTATPSSANVVKKPAKHQDVAHNGKVTKTSRQTAKPKKAKVIRDSFTMPAPEYELISAIKRRCLAKGLAVKKSEVLRAAICGLAAQSDDYLVSALGALEVIQTGRPPKERK